MNISKKMAKRTNTEPQSEKYSGRYVVDESVIDDFVRHLRIYDAEAAIASLQAVADVTADMLNKPEGELEQSDLKVIKRLAGENKNKLYRQIMKAITEASAQGSEGIKAAHRTAARAVEVGFRWSIYYFETLEVYRSRLRSISRAARSDK